MLEMLRMQLFLYGQGMNCGFEDCVVLNELMEKHGDNWDIIFEEFQNLRKPDADAIAELALANFIEMRDRVGNPSFLLQKKLKHGSMKNILTNGFRFIPWSHIVHTSVTAKHCVLVISKKLLCNL